MGTLVMMFIGACAGGAIVNGVNQVHPEPFETKTLQAEEKKTGNPTIFGYEIEPVKLRE